MFTDIRLPVFTEDIRLSVFTRGRQTSCVYWSGVCHTSCVYKGCHTTCVYRGCQTSCVYRRQTSCVYRGYQTLCVYRGRQISCVYRGQINILYSWWICPAVTDEDGERDRVNQTQFSSNAELCCCHFSDDDDDVGLNVLGCGADIIRDKML